MLNIFPFLLFLIQNNKTIVDTKPELFPQLLLLPHLLMIPPRMTPASEPFAFSSTRLFFSSIFRVIWNRLRPPPLLLSPSLMSSHCYPLLSRLYHRCCRCLYVYVYFYVMFFCLFFQFNRFLPIKLRAPNTLRFRLGQRLLIHLSLYGV